MGSMSRLRTRLLAWFLIPVLFSSGTFVASGSPSQAFLAFVVALIVYAVMAPLVWTEETEEETEEVSSSR